MGNGKWSSCSSECPIEKGCQCVFPFKIGGITHHACTLHQSPNGEPWCSVEVDEKGEHIPGAWSACSSECPIEEGCQCAFPFLSDGDTAAHNACTLYMSRKVSNITSTLLMSNKVNGGIPWWLATNYFLAEGIESRGYPWCASRVDSQGMVKDWYACKQECPMEIFETQSLAVSGAKCIFPFGYEGSNHNACIRQGHYWGGRPWCSIKNYENGSFAHGGLCSDYCPVEEEEEYVVVEEEEKGKL